jgi:hypothetical protein
VKDDSTGPWPDADDEFDRQLRALTEGSAGEARFKELSADERAKEGARRAKQARREAERSARQAGRAAGPDGPPATGTGRRVVLGSMIIAIAVALVGGAAWLSLHHPSPPVIQNPNQGIAPTPITSLPSTTAVAGGPPPTDPFAGTKADHWADNAAGIVLPVALPVAGYSTAQVTAAYQTTRKLLIAGYLNQQTLLGGAPTAFASLLTAAQRQSFVAGLNKTGRDSRGNEVSTRATITSFARGSTQLIGSVIKVTGTMSARPGYAQGRKALVIEVNYDFVYPVEPPSSPAYWVRIITQLRGSVDFGYWNPAISTLMPWAYLQAFQAGARCDTPYGYVYPDYPNSPPDNVQPSGAPVNPYATGTAVPPPGCDAVTGT